MSPAATTSSSTNCWVRRTGRSANRASSCASGEESDLRIPVELVLTIDDELLVELTAALDHVLGPRA